MADLNRQGIVVTIFSTASAVGKTLLAVNLTAELARQGFHACVVDLDLQFGDVANFLQLNPEKTIFDAQQAIEQNPAAFDPTAFVTPYEHDGTSFSVIPHPLTLEQSYNMTAKSVGKILTELRRVYDYVIIDTVSAFSDINLQAMDMSTIVTAVAIVDFIPTIKNMKIGYEAMKKIGYETNKIRFVLNRSNAKTNIEIADVERLMDASFYHVLPNDFKAAVESIHSAVPIVLDSTKSQSPLGEGLRELADKYTNRVGPVKTTATPQRSGLFSGLFKR